MNPDGTLNDKCRRNTRSHDDKKARDAVVADMEAAGLIAEIEDREIDLAHSDRSRIAPIEPWEADQWFLDMHSPFEDGCRCLADLAHHRARRPAVAPPSSPCRVRQR